jgi:hypothetical protein
MVTSLRARAVPGVVDLSGDCPGPAKDQTGMAQTCERDRLTTPGRFNPVTELKDDRRIAPEVSGP